MFDRYFARSLTVLLVLVAPFAVADDLQQEDSGPGAESHLNSHYVDPDLDVEEWVERFEGESREVFAERHAILKATGVQAGDRVVDIGAGTGLYTRLFAQAVGGKGWVHAVDISTGFLQHINETATAAGLDNVTSVLGRVDSISLPADSVDLAFICDTYHHLEAVEPMLASIHRALGPGGRLIVIEFERIPGESREWILDHTRAGKEVFRAEIEAAGFVLVEDVEIDGFVENYFLKFVKK